MGIAVSDSEGDTAALTWALVPWGCRRHRSRHPCRPPCRCSCPSAPTRRGCEYLGGGGGGVANGGWRSLRPSLSLSSSALSSSSLVLGVAGVVGEGRRGGAGGYDVAGRKERATWHAACGWPAVAEDHVTTCIIYGLIIFCRLNGSVVQLFVARFYMLLRSRRFNSCWL